MGKKTTLKNKKQLYTYGTTPDTMDCIENKIEESEPTKKKSQKTKTCITINHGTYTLEI